MACSGSVIYRLRTQPQAMPEAPAPTPVLSRMMMSEPEPRLRFSSSIARCHPVLRPWMPAPRMTYGTDWGRSLMTLLLRCPLADSVEPNAQGGHRYFVLRA